MHGMKMSSNIFSVTLDQILEKSVHGQNNMAQVSLYNLQKRDQRWEKHRTIMTFQRDDNFKYMKWNIYI